MENFVFQAIFESVKKNKTMSDDKNNIKEQNEQLREMNYDADQDIFSNQKRVRVDENGVPLDEEEEQDDMEMNIDVPGSELDNDQEEIGSEDEENNYWSLGGDDHEDLEQDDNS